MGNYPVLGIDTSHYQDESVGHPLPNFATGADRYAFDLVKITDGWKYGLGRLGMDDFIDPEFQYAYHELGVLGKPRGVYHFYRSGKDPRKQAETVAYALDQAGALPELPIFCDVERNDGMQTVFEYRNGLEKFVIRAEELTGCPVWFYTSAGKWGQFVANPTNGATDLPKGRGLWVANYGVSKPLIPWDWSQRYGPDAWKFWQPGTMNMPGFKSPVDYNYYNGSVDAFEQEFNVKLDPIVTPPPEPEPAPDMPADIRIRGLLAGETLRLRNMVWGLVVAMTWNGIEFEVMGQAKDSLGRFWYQLGPSVWVASWYCEAV